MSTPRFDLVDIAQTLKSRMRFILIVTLLAAAAGAVFYFVSPKRYKATTEFFVCNPLYSDRNNIFRTGQSEFISYFGSDDDIDKLISISKSKLVEDLIVGKQDLAKVYKLDTSKLKDALKLSTLFRSRYDVKRTSTQNMEISYTDTDPQIAANVSTEAVRVIEEIYRGYFNNIRTNIYNALLQKQKEIDSAIVILTDSLARMRDEYHIYDILSPTRNIIVSNGYRPTGTDKPGRAIEEIQNVEAVKDELVRNKAIYNSLMQEFSTGVKLNEMPLIQVISEATPPNKPTGLGLGLTIISAIFLGFFFSSVWVLLSTYFKLLTSVER